ncbi:MAG: heavy metal translocating P-type ATPase metal-binding domain-containing protein [Candidatus Marinimicrobia bacterium]|nr:heavy metal translocating P-type ATPase metal-binding domain-containing protein [Candidatus Neomarinimicrobiota bacterium]
MNTRLATQTCFHCGDDCGRFPIILNDKPFCCNGCKQVYLLLQSSDLCQYYDLNRQPGVSPQTVSVTDQFSFLDNEEIARKLIDFQDDTGTRVRFTLPDMHCSSCIWLLEKLYKLNDAISNTHVNFLQKEITLHFDHHRMSLREIADLLTSIGYEPRLNLFDVEETSTPKTRKTLYIQIAVAGFSFVNIMLLSLPEYFSSGKHLGESFQHFFGYLNILLALPVLLVSSKGYFSSALTGLRHKVINIDVPIVLGILALFTRSVIEIVLHTGAGYMDSFAGLVFLLLIGKLFQQKTFDSLSFDRDYRSYFPVSVHRKTADGTEVIPLSKLVVGDRILIRNGEIVPADSILLKSTAMIDYSFVTGESQPVRKESGDTIFAGGIQTGGMIELEVIRELSQSYLTGLWNKSDDPNRPDGKILQLTDSISRYFTLIVLAIAIISAGYWMMHSPALAWDAFTSVLIVACPCALALSAPFTLGNILRVLSRNGFYLKNASVIESLAKTDTVIFDKTGTLTYGGRSRLKFMPVNGQQIDLSSRELGWIKSVVNQSSHPKSQAIDRGLSSSAIIPVTDFLELPGEGIAGTVDGHRILVGSSSYLRHDPDGDSSDQVWVSIDGQVIGGFNLEEIFRDGLPDVVSRIQSNHQVHLLTGDNDRQKKNLMDIFSIDDMHFNQTPFDKLKFVQDRIRDHHKIVMIGDGLNDAGALKHSHVGIAISEDKNAFSPACDAILDANQFKKLPVLINLSKKAIRVIIASIIISFLYNLAGLGFAVTGKLSPLIAAILMPVSSITVILFATGASNLMAMKLGLVRKVMQSEDYISLTSK